MNDDLADDLLDGAAEIGAFMNWNQRRVFYAAEHNLIPIFRIGNRLCARKSSLRRRIEDLEQRATEEAEESPSG